MEAGKMLSAVTTGLIDRARHAHLELSGPDAVEYLQGQVTNDVASLAPGKGCYSAILNPKGRILADVRILMISAKELWLDMEDEALDGALGDLRMYKIGRAVEIADRSAERSMMSLLGTGADGVLRQAFESDPPDAEHAFVRAQMAGHDVTAVRTLVGFDVICSPRSTSDVRSTLLEAGAQPIDVTAAEGMRIERGLPRYGADMTNQNLPGEAGIVDRAVSFTKGCYVGQEPVARMHHKGHPNRMLRGLRLPSSQIGPGSKLLADGREVGTVGSIGHSSDFGWIGLAILRKEVAAGDQLTVASDGATVTVVELPFC